MAKGYYEILGVSREASRESLRQAFHKLAILYHPDKHSDNPEALDCFKKAAEAYRVLRDPVTRRLYDLFGRDGLKLDPQGEAAGLEEIFSSFSNIFSGLFHISHPRAARPVRRGEDLYYDLEVTLEEAAMGAYSELEVRYQRDCSFCAGTGQRGVDGTEICLACGGKGQFFQESGFFKVEVECARCRGRGRVVTDPCPHCQGGSRLGFLKVCTVRVPPGVTDRQRLHLPGEGSQGFAGGEPGDLYVYVKIAPHRVFTRHHLDLHRRLEIPAAQARRGCQVMIATILDGKKKIRLPADIQSGDVMSLPGLGMPDLEAKRRGDLLVEIELMERRETAFALSPVREVWQTSETVRRVHTVFALRDPGALEKLNQVIARSSLASMEGKDMRTLEGRLEFILAYLEQRLVGGLRLNQAEKKSVAALSDMLFHVRDEQGCLVDNVTIEAFNQRLRSMIYDSSLEAKTSAQSAKSSRPLIVEAGSAASALTQALPAVSYRDLVAKAQENLVDTFLDKYVISFFALPKKRAVQRRFHPLLERFFRSIDEIYQGGGDLEALIDARTSEFVEKNRLLFKTLCNNLGKGNQRGVFLYEFEAYLADAIKYFYQVLESHRREHPGWIVGIPKAPDLITGALPVQLLSADRDGAVSQSPRSPAPKSLAPRFQYEAPLPQELESTSTLPPALPNSWEKDTPWSLAGERRRSRRSPVNLPVEAETLTRGLGWQALSGTVVNVSRRGLHLITESGQSLNEGVAIRIYLQKPKINAQGVVRRLFSDSQGKVQGAGIELYDMSTQHWDRWHKLIS